MDIHKEREAFELVVANKLQNNLYRSLFFNKEIGWYDCADDAPVEVQVFCHDLNCDWLIWKSAKAQAIPDGFVLIKHDSKTAVAIERMVEQQVEASGMDSRRLERLDGWKIIEAAVKAQEQVND